MHNAQRKQTAPTRYITSVSLTETHIAILAGNSCDGAQWEIYEEREPGCEYFSHFATAGEAEQIVDMWKGLPERMRIEETPGLGRHVGLGGPLYTTS